MFTKNFLQATALLSTTVITIIDARTPISSPTTATDNDNDTPLECISSSGPNNIPEEEAQQCGHPYTTENGQQYIPTCINNICTDVKGLYLGMIKTESSSLPEYEDEDDAIITSPIDLLAPALEDGSLVPSGHQWCQLVYTLIGDVDDYVTTDNDNASREKCGAAYVKDGIEYQPMCITGKCEHVAVVVVHGISDEEEKEEEEKEKKNVEEVPLLSKFMFMQ